MLSILSHFRRKWQFIQIKKLGNPYKLEEADTNNLCEFLNLTIEKGYDVFGIKHQFDNWANSNINIPILFLDFNNVLEQKNIINKFLGKDLNYDDFIIKPRKSLIGEGEKEVYEKVYHDLYNYIKQRSFEINKQQNIHFGEEAANVIESSS